MSGVWAVRLIEFGGLSAQRDLWRRENAADLERLLPGTPVALYADLAHASHAAVVAYDGPDPRAVVGRVAAAWAEPDGVYGRVWLRDTGLHAHLAAAERLGRLDAVGLSIVARVIPWPLAGTTVTIITDVLRIYTVDVVARPRCGGAFLHSLGPARARARHHTLVGKEGT
jgi:hypothetical protein